MPDTPEIFLLTNGRGERVGFEPVATVPYGGGIYMILRPVTPMEGAEEGDAFVFALVDGDAAGDDENWLVMETDDAVIDAVFELYEQSLG